MNYNVTPRCQHVFALAAREARTRDHEYFGADHFLLALVQLGNQTVAGAVLQKQGVDLELLGRSVDAKMSPSDYVLKVDPEITPHMFRVLKVAQEQANVMNNGRIAMEHVILGILSAGDGIAHRVLVGEFRIGIEEFKKEVLSHLNSVPDEDLAKAVS